MRHARKLEQATKKMLTLEEMEQQMVRKLQNTQHKANMADLELQKVVEGQADSYEKRLAYKRQ